MGLMLTQVQGEKQNSALHTFVISHSSHTGDHFGQSDVFRVVCM